MDLKTRALVSCVLEDVYLSLVTAAKVDDLKAQYPELAEKIGELSDALLLESAKLQTKYLSWSVGQLRLGSFVEDIVDVVKKYDKSLVRLTGRDRDIGSFKTLSDVLAVVEKAEGVETRGDIKKKAKKGGVILHEDDRWLLVRPETQASSIYYGSNTAWCISRRDLEENYWYNYFSERNVRFYFLIDKAAAPRTQETEGYHFSKLAMLFSNRKPFVSEAFQDAANRHPHRDVLEKALGSAFVDLYAVALADARKLPEETWAHSLLVSGKTDVSGFLELYEQHKAEVLNLPEPEANAFDGRLLSFLKTKDSGLGVLALDRLSRALQPERESLAESVSFIIRLLGMVSNGFVAPELSVKLLELASTSSSPGLKKSIASIEPRYLPKDVVRQLLNDLDYKVQAVMVRNPVVMSDPELRALAVERASKGSEKVWGSLLLNRACPLYVFERLAVLPRASGHEFDVLIAKLIEQVDASVGLEFDQYRGYVSGLLDQGRDWESIVREPELGLGLEAFFLKMESSGAPSLGSSAAERLSRWHDVVLSVLQDERPVEAREMRYELGMGIEDDQKIEFILFERGVVTSHVSDALGKSSSPRALELLFGLLRNPPAAEGRAPVTRKSGVITSSLGAAQRFIALEELAGNDHLPVKVQEDILGLEDVDLLGDGETFPADIHPSATLFMRLAGNHGLVSDVVNEVIVHVVEMLLDGTTELSRPRGGAMAQLGLPPTYQNVMERLASNPAVGPENVAFLKRWVANGKEALEKTGIATGPESVFAAINQKFEEVVSLRARG